MVIIIRVLQLLASGDSKSGMNAMPLDSLEANWVYLVCACLSKTKEILQVPKR